MMTAPPTEPTKLFQFLEINYSFLSSLVLPILISVLTLLVLSKGFKSRRKWAFPGPSIREIFEILQAPHKLKELGQVWSTQHGHRVDLSFGWKRTLLLTHPDDIKTVLASSSLITKSDNYNLLRPWTGMSLVLEKGARWHRLRKLLGPVFFHFQSLESFRAVFNEQSMIFVDIIREGLEKTGESGEFKLFSMLNGYTLATITENSLGIKSDCQRNPAESFAEAIRRGGGRIGKRFRNLLLHSDTLFSLSKLGREAMEDMGMIRTFIDKIISEQSSKSTTKGQANLNSPETPARTLEDEQSNKKANKENRSFLGLLLNAERDEDLNLSQVDIRNEALSFLVAGTDTTSAALFWTIMLLAKHSEEQAKLVQELDAVFGNDRQRPVTSADLHSLPYLDCCVKEGLRLYPIAFFMGRKVEQDFQLDATTVIPKGVDIVLSPLITHGLSEFFPDPSEFRPSRFLPENSDSRHPHAFFAFSAGPRNCIGQKYALASEKILLANVFRNFKVSPVDPIESIPLVLEIVLQPGVDGRCKFQLRP